MTRNNWLLCVVMCLTIFFLFANASFAGLMVEIKVAPGQDSPDGKWIQPFLREVIKMQVWATVTGSNGIATDDKLQTVSGGIQLTGDGSLELDTTDHPFGYVAPFDQSSSTPSVSEKYLGLGGSTAATGPLWWRAASIQSSSELNHSYLLGTFNYRFPANPQGASINYVKPGSSVGTLTFMIDGQSKTGMASSGLNITSVGKPCYYYVPEPSTIVLLGLGALALVFVRRRK